MIFKRCKKFLKPIDNIQKVCYNVYRKKRKGNKTMYTMKEIEQAYDAYRAEMEYEDFTPMTFEEFKDEQEAEGYWRVDAYLLW